MYSAVMRDVNGDILGINQVITPNKVKALFKAAYQELRSMLSSDDIHYRSITFYRNDAPFLEMSVSIFAISWHRTDADVHGWMKDNIDKIRA